MGGSISTDLCLQTVNRRKSLFIVAVLLVIPTKQILKDSIVYSLHSFDYHGYIVYSSLSACLLIITTPYPSNCCSLHNTYALEHSLHIV